MNLKKATCSPAIQSWSIKQTSLFWTVFVSILLLSITKHAFTFSTGPTQLENDALEYWERGGRVAAGDVFQLQAAVNYRGPVYPWLVGACRWLDPNQGMRLLSIVQHLMSMIVGLLVAKMAWDLFKSRLGVLVGYAMNAASITAPWFANVVLTEITFQFIFTLCVWMLIRYHQRPSVWNSIGFGAFLALSILTRPIPKLLWIPILLLFFCHVGPRYVISPLPWKRISIHALLGWVAMVLVLAPWTIRNHLHFKNSDVAKVPPINKWVVCFHDKSGGNLSIPTTQSGQTIRMHLPDIDHNEQLRHDGYEVLRRLQSKSLNESQLDQIVSDVCHDAIWSNPMQFFWQSLKRFGNFWRCTVKDYPFYSTYPSNPTAMDFGGDPGWRLESMAERYEWFLRNSLFTRLRYMELHSSLCFLGVIGMIACLRTRVIGISLGVLFLYFAGVTGALEIENYRYRMVLEPTISVVIAGLLLSLLQLRQNDARQGSES